MFFPAPLPKPTDFRVWENSGKTRFTVLPVPWTETNGFTLHLNMFPQRCTVWEKKSTEKKMCSHACCICSQTRANKGRRTFTLPRQPVRGSDAVQAAHPPWKRLHNIREVHTCASPSPCPLFSAPSWDDERHPPWMSLLSR